jgi:sporulation protein YlmC with PRC-barrel domain
VIQVPVDAKVECTDGHAGRSSHTIIDPVRKTVTHVVVTTEESFASRQWLVPIDHIIESTSELIRLDCTLEELSEMDEFSQHHYVEAEEAEPGEMAYPTYAYMSPYAVPLRTDYIPVEVERIPPGELAIRRGAIMEATDGYVGKVGEFLVDPESGHITHLILQEGHLWGKKEVLVPLSAVDHSLEDTVFLKLDKESVAGLPAIAVTRSYRRTKDSGGFQLVARVYDDLDSASKALEIVKVQQGDRKCGRVNQRQRW